MKKTHKCARCKKVKAVNAFYPKLLSWCRLCRKAYRKARYAALTPEDRINVQHRAKLIRAGII